MPENQPPKFKPGDPVTWTSQAGGRSKTKRGTVIAVVPRLSTVGLYIPSGMTARIGSGLQQRSMDSYLVKVADESRLYWPLVKYLKPVEEKFLPLTLHEDGRFENEGEDNSERYENPGPDALHILNPSEPKGESAHE